MWIEHLPRRRQRLAAQARAGLLWGLGFFAAAHLAIWVATQTFWPQLRDPEYGYKLSLLRRRRAAEPDRPVLLLLGSSRTGQGLRPDVMPDLVTPDGRRPLVFNFSQVGSGPLAELLVLRRLLDAGVRPDWLAVEVLPALLGRTVDAFGAAGDGVGRLTWTDLRLLRRYVPDPRGVARHWYQAQLVPWYAHRFPLMNHFAPEWLPWRLRLDHWKKLDPGGWSDIGSDDQPLGIQPQALEVARKTYQEELGHIRLTAMQDRAMRDLLALCRAERIPVVLYLMPEGTLYRGWYAPSSVAVVDGYLAALSREYGVPVVDARRWVADPYFADSHHLLRAGARVFSRRFGADVLSRLVKGDESAIPSLLPPAPPTVLASGGR